jgi:hypothetical protein
MVQLFEEVVVTNDVSFQFLIGDGSTLRPPRGRAGGAVCLRVSIPYR